MFCVVVFSGEKDGGQEEVEVVPKSWVSEDSKSCWWPNYRSYSRLKNAVQNCDPPDDGIFTKFQVRVLKTYASYDVARANLKQAEEDSDLNSEKETTPSVRKARHVAPKRLQYDVPIGNEKRHKVPKLCLVSESLPPNSQSLPPLPPPPAITAHFLQPPPSFQTPPLFTTNVKRPPQTLAPPLASNSEAFSDSFVIQSTSTMSASKTPVLVSEDIESVDLSDFGSADESLDVLQLGTGISKEKGSVFQNWVFRNMSIIKAQLKQLQESVDALSYNDSGQFCRNNRAAVPIQDLEVTTPVGTLEELERLLEYAVDDSNVKILVSKLSLRGGSNLGNTVRRNLRFLFKDEVALKYSWLGTRGDKKAFATSPLKPILYESIWNNPKFKTAQDGDIEEFVKNWLKNTKKRIQARNKRTSRHQVQPDI